MQCRAKYRDGCTRIRQLPPHHQHEQETKKEESQSRNTVLNADHLVISGKDPLLHKADVMMVINVIVGPLAVTAVKDRSFHG